METGATPVLRRFLLDTATTPNHIHRVRTCVIFNPAARGEKSQRFRRHLTDFADCAFKPTTAPGVGRTLAAEAVAEGFETIVAAGGDGTINEVLNGIGEVPDGFKKARLAVLPLGTVNVFAKELGLPSQLDRAWKVIQQGHERRIDLPRVEFQKDGKPARQYFAQLAGAGLDARAIELVSWKLKKQAGPLAYVAAGIQALNEKLPYIEVAGGGRKESGQLVLIGNGRFYGGRFQIFPGADLCDGMLEVCVFPKANWAALIHCGATLLPTGKLPTGRSKHFRAASLKLTGLPGTPFEVDGDLCGQLPASFSIEPLALRVVAPELAM